MQRMNNNVRVQLSEIFTSIEGEGVLVGTKTLFVRMAGCHLKCHWCDTTYALSMNSGLDYSISDAKELIRRELKPNTFKINFTGGEPLIQYEAVIELAKFASVEIGLRTYLESSCFDSGRFAKVLPYLDICKIEFKLRDSKAIDSRNYPQLVYNEIKCLKMAVQNRKRTYIKIVVTKLTDQLQLEGLVKDIFSNVKATDLLGFVIQPSIGTDEPGMEKLLNFYDCIYPIYEEVRIIPQLHKVIGVR